MRVAKASQWKPSREEAQACGPAEGTPDHPAFGQQDKAAPGLREFDPLGTIPVFPHPGFPEQNRVTPALLRKNPGHMEHLGLPPDHGLQFAAPRQFGGVPAEERMCGLLMLRRLSA